MGLMGRILGAGGAAREVGAAVTGVAEVFVGNRAEREAAEAGQLTATLGEYAAEFAGPRTGWFDGFVNGLNRLPRPMLAISTLALFGYAMAARPAFRCECGGWRWCPSRCGGCSARSCRSTSARANCTTDGRASPRPRRRRWRSPRPLAASNWMRHPNWRRRARRARPIRGGRPSLAVRLLADVAEGNAHTGRGHRPQCDPAPKATPVVAVRAADPNFNAAVEEWRRLNG